MEAFRVLQLQTDDKHKRITNQVSTVCKILVMGKELDCGIAKTSFILF